MGEGGLTDAVVRDPRRTAVGVLRRNLAEGVCKGLANLAKTWGEATGLAPIAG